MIDRTNVSMLTVQGINHFLFGSQVQKCRKAPGNIWWTFSVMRISTKLRNHVTNSGSSLPRKNATKSPTLSFYKARNNCLDDSCCALCAEGSKECPNQNHLFESTQFVQKLAAEAAEHRHLSFWIIPVSLVCTAFFWPELTPSLFISVNWTKGWSFCRSQ